MKGQSVGPYRVLRKLGAGGMGDVYLADDDRLRRQVALKSPSDAWLQTPDARARLQREARAAARLNHPNIAAVYDVLESDGRPFIVMEHVEGESLASVLARGRVPVERGLEIGIQLARALEAAHAAGIIHRDLKPGNVMITPEGRVKVLDFGLAKLPDVDPETGPLTHPGQMLGTPGYVAPEQLLGHRADARSDIYSAGAILYQLLSGRPPWGSLDERGRALTAILAPVPNLATLDATLPSDVCAIVARAMEREPGDRFASAAELRRALEAAARELRERPTIADVAATPPRRRASRGFVAAVAVVLIVAAGLPFVWRWRTAPSTAATKGSALPVIAVLPLENLSGDPGAAYLGAGMAETMSTKLASVRGVAVVSRSEIRDALTRNVDITKVSRALGATFLVTGAVQQAAGRVQVTINLLSGDGRRIRDGEIYEDSIDNLFQLQRQIAENLTRRIFGTLSSTDEQQLARNPAKSVAALSAYWRGKNLLDQPGLEPVEQAIAAFEEAVRLDPSFAVGYAGLGSAFWRKYVETNDRTWADKAVSETERARQINPREPEVHYALATVYQGSGRSDDAVTELKRVIELQPAHDAAHRVLGDIFAEQQRVDEAVAEYREALNIRPDYWGTYRSLGVVYWHAGRYEEALAAFNRIIELQPDSPYGYQLRGTVHGTMHDLRAATEDYEAALTRGGTPATNSALGTVYYLQGRFEDAVRSYKDAIAQRPNRAVTHWNLADAYRQLGRTADARAEYRRAVQLYDADLAVNPNLATAVATRALCLAHLARVSEAIDQTDRAVRLAPGNPDVLYVRALVLAMAGRKDEALGALEQAVTAGYSVDLLRGDRDLAALRSSGRFQTLLADGAAASRRNSK